MASLSTHAPAIDADFAGGNIICEQQSGDTFPLNQNWADCKEWWFYWAFRVRHAAGCTLRFTFTDGDVFTTAGPCVSTDRLDWRWLGREVVRDNGFSFTLPDDLDQAYFALCPMYTQDHLDRFLAGRPQLTRRTMCDSEAGRPVQLLAHDAADPQTTLLLTARSHACEAVASYELEGVLDYFLSDEPAARRMRETVDLRVVPFRDVDGVEQGHQGKFRLPHDHNQDWIDQPRYAVTRSLMQRIADRRTADLVGLDLHCPWIRGGWHEQILFVCPPEPMASEVERFSALLEQHQRGELVYRRSNNLPFGVDWNQGKGHGMSTWLRQQPGVRLAATIELPYAHASGQTVTIDNARAFGTDVGRALAVYLARHP